MHKIVVVGGGAGGLELATRLGDRLGSKKRAHVTLVDRCPAHVWKPLLHEVATGSLDTHAHQIDFAAQAHWHHFHFVQGEMIGIDRGAKRLRVGAVPGENGHYEILPARSVEYDTLVLALGSRTHFFGVPGAEDNAITLDSLEQAERLRRRLIETCIRKQAFGEAEACQDVNVVIIGGGATGVELSAALREMERGFRKFGIHSSPHGGGMNIALIEAGPRILPALPQRVSSTATALLERLGIDVSVDDPVTGVDRHTVTTHSGRSMPTDITIWAAGIRAPEVLSQLDGIEVNRINQIKVSRHLESESDPDIFAMGDCASCSWDLERTVPPRAQAAHQQAVYLANALRLRLDGYVPGEFSYTDRGSLVSLGPASAIGNLMHRSTGRHVIVRGAFAKLMYSALYRKHLATVSSTRRAFFNFLAHALRRAAKPQVRLH